MCSGAKIKIAPPPPPPSTKKMGLVPKSSSSNKIANKNNPSSSSAASTKKISNSSSKSNINNSADTGNTAAFNGAKFDKFGYCLKHPSIQLVNPMKDDNGKLIYQEIKVTCPSCQASKYKAKKSTSLGGGKVRTGHRVHGAPPPSSSSSRSGRSKSRERGSSERGRSKSTSRGSQSGRSASKSRERSSGTNNHNPSSSSSSKPQRHYETPFDSKGRCHYHKNVQLAAKKMTGGWKMLHSACPKCMEDKLVCCGDIVSDDRSVKSSSSRRSLHRADTHGSGSTGGSGGGGGGEGVTQFDKNGCCVLHTHVQVAKKRVFGTGYKVVRACPACAGAEVTADDMSVSSKKSTRSTSSRKSSRSVRSSTSRGAATGGGGSGSGSKQGRASKSGRYGALPFDGDGYCCRHPNIQLAKKKALGGYKIIHDVCPECAHDDEDNRSVRSRGSSRSRRSKSASRRNSNGTGRVFDDTGSVTSSVKSSGSKGGGGGRNKKKRIRVRNLKTQDEEGKPGRYSGHVNDDHLPHGNGVMSYTDGSVYEGVWNEGSKVCGKTKK